MSAITPRAPARLSSRLSSRLFPPRPRPLVLLALALLLLLQGCWTAERYVARVRIEADGSYKYFIEGTAMHTSSVCAMRCADYEVRVGKLKVEDAKKMREAAAAGLAKDLEALGKDPRVQSVTNIGDGRVRFMASGKGSINGGEILFIERNAPLAYARAPGKALKVWLKDAVVGQDAESLKLKVDGDVSITLGEGIEVLEHNAYKTPTVPGGAYRWHVEKPGDPAPRMLLRLPAP